nr:hypothetical protein [uncultured Desulfobulbus sp.]
MQYARFPRKNSPCTCREPEQLSQLQDLFAMSGLVAVIPFAGDITAPGLPPF